MENLNISQPQKYYKELAANFFESVYKNDMKKLERFMGHGMEKACFQLTDNLVIKMPIGLLEKIENAKDSKDFFKPYKCEIHTIGDVIHLFTDQIYNEVDLYNDIPKSIKHLFNSILFYDEYKLDDLYVPYYICPLLDTDTEELEFQDCLYEMYDTDIAEEFINTLIDFCDNNDLDYGDILLNDFNYGFDESGKPKILDYGLGW